MKVLWLSSQPGQLDIPERRNSYNGGGWIGALQGLLLDEREVKLGVAFPMSQPMERMEQRGVTYYPVHTPAPSALAKMRTYYGGYKHWKREQHVEALRQVIAHFQPDVIHLFGIENPFANILGRTEVPVVVHLQGFLAPYDNAFFPQGLNKSSFIWPPSMREWVWRNGYIFAKKNMHVRGLQEIERFRDVRHTMGRTAWDYSVSRLLAPASTYHVVNEVLRPVFYDHAGQWRHHEHKRTIIVSTVSQTVYKGVDLILKAAKLLREHTEVDFEWRVIGVGASSPYVRYFERTLGIRGADFGVRYLGIMGAEALCAQLLEGDIYVHPSYIDNSPNSLCEAQLIGLPAIGTFVGGIPSLITHGESGLLIPANAPFELAYHLQQIATDTALAHRLSLGAAQAAAKRHDRRQIVRDLIATYKEACTPK